MLHEGKEFQGNVYSKYKPSVTIQLTSDLPDSAVKSAHIHLYTARFIPLEQIRGNLNSYQSSGQETE